MSTNSERRQLYAFLGIILIVASGSIIALMVLSEPSNDQSIELINIDSVSSSVTLDEMLAMDAVSRVGSFQNTFGNQIGKGSYVGVKISDILELVGGMDTSEILVITAFDGYQQNFTYDNVYPNSSFYDLQGDMLLAYSYNGSLVPQYEEGFRIVFLPEDENYSNDDAEATTLEEYFPDGAGPRCVSKVESIRIMDESDVASVLVSIDMTMVFEFFTSVNDYFSNCDEKKPYL
ncbi:MAG: hypothetical protein ACTSQZ_00350 [Candidatus Thorarchaeota archaeon]